MVISTLEEFINASCSLLTPASREDDDSFQRSNTRKVCLSRNLEMHKLSFFALGVLVGMPVRQKKKKSHALLSFMPCKKISFTS